MRNEKITKTNMSQINQFYFCCFRVIEAAHVASEEEVSLTFNGKTFSLNLASMHEIREDSGTARPIQRKLTSQLQNDLESDEEKAKYNEHLELTSELTKLLFPVLLEVYSNSAGPGVRHNCIQVCRGYTDCVDYINLRGSNV